jgi:signal transduction histidine kinase
MSNDQIYQSIKTLMKSINNVGDLLDNLMIWSQMNTNDILFAPSQYRLTEIIDDVLEDFGVYLKTKDITVDVDIKIDNSEVFCDADMIWRVIRNLISNAMKYSYEHSKVEITVMEWTNDDYLLVEVRDYGVGMFPEIMAKLFRIDERVALSGTLGEKGSGLGLILCKEFIDRHNGAIWCGSEIGKGSTFYFTLARKK